MEKVCEKITVDENVGGFRCCREYDADEVAERLKYYLAHCKNGTMNITFETKIESEVNHGN